VNDDEKELSLLAKEILSVEMKNTNLAELEETEPSVKVKRESGKLN